MDLHHYFPSFPSFPSCPSCPSCPSYPSHVRMTAWWWPSPWIWCRVEVVLALLSVSKVVPSRIGSSGQRSPSLGVDRWWMTMNVEGYWRLMVNNGKYNEYRLIQWIGLSETHSAELSGETFQLRKVMGNNCTSTVPLASGSPWLGR